MSRNDLYGFPGVQENWSLVGLDLELRIRWCAHSGDPYWRQGSARDCDGLLNLLLLIVSIRTFEVVILKPHTLHLLPHSVCETKGA